MQSKWCAAVAVVLAVVVIAAVRMRAGTAGGSKKSPYCSGPYNLQLYDYPYYYPFYVGREVGAWDGDKRCVKYCSQWPCTIWCR